MELEPKNNLYQQMLGMYGDLNQEMEVERIYARKTVVESTAHGDDYSNNANRTPFWGRALYRGNGKSTDHR